VRGGDTEWAVPDRYLPIYLNDHLAGATVGVELVRRAARENDGSELGAFLAELRGEIESDRKALLELMATLGIAPSLAKSGAAWLAEKVGRLKLNGRLTGYSPLSQLVELEGIAAGVEGKGALWTALAEVRDRDERLAGFPLDELRERARSQRERIEPFRLAAARNALA
jgi:hypothetical protein